MRIALFVMTGLGCGRLGFGGGPVGGGGDGAGSDAVGDGGASSLAIDSTGTEVIRAAGVTSIELSRWTSATPETSA